MFKYIIKTMGGVDWMAVVPLILFVTVFSITSILWLRRNKEEVAEMAKLPLEDGTKN